ncbi:asparagine synthetase B, partial [Thermococci archaeon]
IVCIIKNISPNSKIKTFSAVFPGKNIDETKYINEVIKRTNVISFLTTPTPTMLFQDLNDVIKTQEEPFLGTSIYAQYSVMKLAHKNNMKVLLDGQGGDEIFAGYPSYINPYFLELFMNFKWRFLVSQFKWYFRTYRNMSPIFFILSRPGRFFLKNKSKPFWIKKSFFQSYSSSKKFKNSLSQRLIQDLTYSTIPSYLRYEDKNAMRWSIETRLPFLDHEFVEKTIFLPAEYKIRNGITKYIFRKAIKDILPEKIRLRTDKIGFATPMDAWLKSELFIELTDNLIDSDAFKERIYWDWKKVKKEFEKYKNNEKNISLDVWKWII